MEKVMFNNTEYPALWIGDNQLIATESLEEKLFTEEGDYVSNQAKRLDEKIYFFVPDEVMNGGIKTVIDYVEKECV